MKKRLSILFLLALLPALSWANTILVLGDSLSAAYGIDPEEGWVKLLERELNGDTQGTYKVVNASTSGETTGGGLSRLQSLIAAHKPNLVIIELGGNDGLRGYGIKQVRQNLADIATQSREAGAQVLLLGMQIPPNYGRRYTEQFSGMYPKLADDLNLPLVPFFLDKVALRREWMQPDGIHPRAEAQRQMLDNVLPTLGPLLK